MTDRELMHKAAKAAGYTGAEYREASNAPATMAVPYPEGSGQLCDGFLWNPLEDDGDAFRLQVALSLDVRIFLSLKTLIVFHGMERHEFRFTGCPYAATRQAIVHAAALRGDS